MIRQICLSCYKTVELPDDTAGQDTPCPNCGKVISVPAKYAAGVAAGGGLAAAPPVPPAPPIPPPPGTRFGAPPMSSDPSAPPGLKSEVLSPPPVTGPPADGLTRGFGVALDPKWLDWVPAGCVLLAFLLAFFPWAEMKLGGYTVMSQNGWDAFFGGKSYNPPVNPPGGADAVKQWEELDNKLSGRMDDKSFMIRTNWLIVLYVLLLLGTVILFVVERVVRDPAAIPALANQQWLPGVWKWRLVFLGGLAVLLFALLAFQSVAGFGLQQSIDVVAKQKFQKELNEPNPTDTQYRSTLIAVGQEAGKYPVTQTLWLRLLLLLHGLAVVAMAARFWLASREAKPLPRADVRW